MSPASQQQDSRLSVQQTECQDGSPQVVTLKICECFFEEGREARGEDVGVILEEEEEESATKDSGPVETNDDEEEESERLSLVNETGSCSGEEEGEGGGLIDQDDSIYQVQFPTSFVELDDSVQSRQLPQQTDLTDSHRNEKNEKVEAWLNTEPSLKKQRKGILRRKSQLDEDIFQLSGSDENESFTRKIHPKYASLNVVRDFVSPGGTGGERDLSGSSGGGKRKRVRVVEEDLIVPIKRCRPASSPAHTGWLDYLPGWVSGFFR